MNCSKCGFQINEGDQICSNCGNPLTALSHNEVVTQEIPEKVDNTVVNESVPVNNEPVFIETPTPEPVVTPSEPVINNEPVNTPEVLTETPLTGVNTAPVSIEKPKKTINIKTIVIIIIALLVIGAGVFFGLKYFNNKTPEPIPLEEEEEEVLEERYYPIESATGLKIIEEYDYYRVQAKTLTKGTYDTFESKLKVEASKITIEDNEFEALFTSYKYSEKKDVITKLNVSAYKGDSTIETSMDITVYTEERVNEILNAFVSFYTPGSTSKEEYDAYGSYDGGYKIIHPNGITMIIGYNELEENGNTYYIINILESI